MNAQGRSYMAPYLPKMRLIVAVLINLAVVTIFGASGYALTVLRRPKLGVALAVVTLAFILATNTPMTHWVRQHPPCFSDGCGNSPVRHPPL